MYVIYKRQETCIRILISILLSNLLALRVVNVGRSLSIDVIKRVILG